MLINANLPLDFDYLSHQDQTLSFAGMSWADYEKFDSQEYLGYRVSYYNGVITLVSPSQNHEVIAEVINYLIVICLPSLAAEELANFVNRGLTESPLTIESDFLKSLQ